MCIYSDFWLQWEKKNLSPYATHSDHVWYSKRGENEQQDSPLDRFGNRSRYRTAFEIDKDRITNSQAFRRLEYKTQVFVTHEGDNYRTRLTHSLEVAENARHIARALRLNEHLAEAIALGHDLGHAPYGHVAEKTINRWINKSKIADLKNNYYFCHNRHSVEVVDHLEPGYDWDKRNPEEGLGRGLNLTNAVREGILTHTSRGYRGYAHKGKIFNEHFENAIRRLNALNKISRMFYPGTLEAQVVRIADELAQRVHDLEDGFRSNLIDKRQIRILLHEYFNKFHAKITIEDTQLCISELATTIARNFLDDIVNESFPEDYTPSDDERETRLKLASEVAFLLHMWRNNLHISELPEKDVINAKNRIGKYLSLLVEILGDSKDSSVFPPEYHILAFLRGIMLANVIEHSFWSIHYILDPKFPEFNTEMGNIVKKHGKLPEINEENKWYVIYVIVDGLTKFDDDKKIKYTPAEQKTRLHCFAFESWEEAEKFIADNHKDIMATNGNHLEMINSTTKIDIYTVNWLNKSEVTPATERVKLTASDGTVKWIPLDNIRLYFTGYRDLCPGAERNICNIDGYRCTGQDNIIQTDKRCPFEENVKRPDINRLIDFQTEMNVLDTMLEKLISDRLHNRSRIERMNYMGDKVIRFLLKLYYKYPRTMHDRVWLNLREYANVIIYDKDIIEWMTLPIKDKESRIFPKGLLDKLKSAEYHNDDIKKIVGMLNGKSATTFRYISELKEYLDREFPNINGMDLSRYNFKDFLEYLSNKLGIVCDNNYTLARRIIEHIAGMTDRFVANEYNRVNQCGREVEIQDEMYFYS